MIVFNAPNTSGKRCSCGTWLDHWQKCGRFALPRYCPVIGCVQTELVGAHVMRLATSNDRTVYIVPICARHNAQAEMPLILLDIPLVPSDACK